MKPYLLLGLVLMYLGSLWGAVKYGEQRCQTRAVIAASDFKDEQAVEVDKNTQKTITQRVKVNRAVEKIKETNLNKVKIPDEQWRAM